MLNSFRFVWNSFNGENTIHGKTLRRTFTQNVADTYFRYIRLKNWLNYYKFILIIQCNINLLNSFCFVWKSLNDGIDLHRKTLRRLFTKNVAHMYFREIEWESTHITLNIVATLPQCCFAIFAIFANIPSRP